MKNILIFSLLIFLIHGCASSNKTATIKSKITQKFYIEDFIYKKEQIEYFEKNFEEILSQTNIEFLKKHVNFYKKNSSYFINPDYKAKLLEEKINSLEDKSSINTHKDLLRKTLTSSPQVATNIYEDLAKENNIYAQRKLVELYKYTAPKKAIYWYNKLIKNNDIKATLEFAQANIYMTKPVIVQDINKAVKLYEKLSSLNDTKAIMALANIYEYGYHSQVVPKDKIKALKLYEKAASFDYTNAQKKLVKIYLCSKCKPNRYNKEKAVKLLKILAKKGVKSLDK